jgi:hypothetical protein
MGYLYDTKIKITTVVVLVVSTAAADDDAVHFT